MTFKKQACISLECHFRPFFYTYIQAISITFMMTKYAPQMQVFLCSPPRTSTANLYRTQQNIKIIRDRQETDSHMELNSTRSVTPFSKSFSLAARLSNRWISQSTVPSDFPRLSDKYKPFNKMGLKNKTTERRGKKPRKKKKTGSEKTKPHPKFRTYLHLCFLWNRFLRIDLKRYKIRNIGN